MSAGDSDGNPIGSIYAYIDYGDRISETDETNNDYYLRTTDLINYHGIDDGPSGGAVSTSIDPNTTYPNAITAEAQFLDYLSSQSLTPQVINFEESQGWGYGNFAGTEGDYENSHVDPSVSLLVSAPYSQSGNGNPDQNATGSIAYLGDTTESQVRFDLINTNGTFSRDESPDDPGIGKIDNSNNFDRGISTTETSEQFEQGQWLEFESSEIEGAIGQLNITFERPVSAVGFYLIGREDTKNDVTLTLNMADGSSQIPVEAYPIVPTGDDDTGAGNLSEGSVQYLSLIHI